MESPSYEFAPLGAFQNEVNYYRRLPPSSVAASSKIQPEQLTQSWNRAAGSGRFYRQLLAGSCRLLMAALGQERG